MLRKHPDFAACKAVPTAEPKESPYFLERESELAGTTDEDEALPVRIAIEPMPAGAAWRRWQQADPLVVPDGLYVDTGAFRQGSNGRRDCSHFRV
jgi:hypothetical protein